MKEIFLSEYVCLLIIISQLPHLLKNKIGRLKSTRTADKFPVKLNVNSYFKNWEQGVLALADPRGGAPGTRAPCPRGSKFFHFHAVFCKKLKNNSIFGSWRTPSGKSWIRHYLADELPPLSVQTSLFSCSFLSNIFPNNRFARPSSSGIGTPSSEDPGFATGE